MTLRNLEHLTQPPSVVTQSMVWATVTQASPLRIKLDGEAEALSITPDTLVAGLQEDDRVYISLTTNNDPAFSARRVVVLGRAGGGGGVPPGVVAPYAGSAAPEGWLLCDGSAVSRTTYAGLFAVIGTTYGSGDGSTTFNLPDLRGRVPVGRDASQAEFNTLGEAGGAKTHTLTTAEIPAHNHGSAGNHTHNVRYRSGGTLGPNDINDAAARMFGGSLDTSSFSTLSGGAHTHASVGGGQPHNNLQPYRVLNYIIKV